MKVEIKPISVNLCWQGRRFKTKTYKKFEHDLLLMLPKIKLGEPPYELLYKFHFSNKASDLDNPVKPITDILQKKYGFNDKDIYRLIVEKYIVKKGQEYFEFFILPYEL